ncbi:unnamed protein product [Cochlearia groenlandica]
MEDNNGACGEFPEHGAIFMSNSYTRRECLRRGLFGSPMFQAGFVEQVKDGMLLFLFEFESRELHGVFQACSDGAMNIEPDAFSSTGKQFPAQVKFAVKWRCRPLHESEFRHAICENYFTAKKFNFGLSKAQVQRLMKLFSSNKIERPRLRKSASAKPTRKYKTDLRNRPRERDFGDHHTGETDGDVDRKFPLTSVGDFGYRSTENYGFGDESEIGLEYGSTIKSEYSRDTSSIHRRLVYPKMHRSKKLRHTSSGRLDNEYHEKDGIAQQSLWSKHKEHCKVKTEPLAPSQRSVPVESPCGTSVERYDPCDPGIVRDTTMKSSRHDLGVGAPNVDTMGYVNDTLPSEPEPNDVAIMNETSIPGFDDDYIPMPTEYLEYRIKTGMIKVPTSESRTSPLCHFQFPGLLTSEGDTKDSHRIFPSFANPLLSRDLSSTDRFNKNETSSDQHKEEFGAQDSHSNNSVVHGPRIYHSFIHPSTSGNRTDLYPENRARNKVQAYQRHEEFGSDAFDSKDRVVRMKHFVDPSEFEIKRTRNSVFSRLSMPSKECVVEKDTESADEVMAFLNECQRHCTEQKEKVEIHTADLLGNDLKSTFPFFKATRDDMLYCEESIEHSANPTLECKDGTKHSAFEDKTMELLRPELGEDDSEKDIGGNNENFSASRSDTEVHFYDFLGLGDQ